MISDIAFYIDQSSGFDGVVKDGDIPELYYQFGYALEKFIHTTIDDDYYYNWALDFFEKAINMDPNNCKYWQAKYKLQLAKDNAFDMFNTMNDFFERKDIKKTQFYCLSFLNEWATVLSEKADIMLCAMGDDPRSLWADIDYLPEVKALYKQLQRHKKYFIKCSGKKEKLCKSLEKTMIWVERLIWLSNESST